MTIRLTLCDANVTQQTDRRMDKWQYHLPSSANNGDVDVIQSSVDRDLTHHSGRRLGLSCTVLLDSCDEQRPNSPASSHTTSPVSAFFNR